MNKLLILLLLLIVIVCAFNLTKKNIESFKSESMSWGYNPSTEYRDWNNTHCQQIVGPDPSKEIVNNWQYNPENTQVDYKYYKDNNDTKYESVKHNLNSSNTQNRIVQQLAPVTWAYIGKNTDPMDQIVPVIGQETRVPNTQSTQAEYVIPSPSLPPKYIGSNTNYVW